MPIPLSEDVPADLLVTRDDAMRILDDLRRQNTRDAQREYAEPGLEIRMLRFDEREATLRALQLVLLTMDRKTVLVRGEPEAISLL